MRNWQVLAFFQRRLKTLQILYKVCSDYGNQPIGDIFEETVASLERFFPRDFRKISIELFMEFKEDEFK